MSEGVKAAPGDVVSETKHATSYRGATAATFEGEDAPPSEIACSKQHACLFGAVLPTEFCDRCKFMWQTCHLEARGSIAKSRESLEMKAYSRTLVVILCQINNLAVVADVVVASGGLPEWLQQFV